MDISDVCRRNQKYLFNHRKERITVNKALKIRDKKVHVNLNI